MLTNNIDMSTEYNTYDTQRRKHLDHLYKAYVHDDQAQTQEGGRPLLLDPNAEHNRLKYSAEESTYASTHNGGYLDYSTIIWSFIDEYIRLDNPDIDNADVYSVHRGAEYLMKTHMAIPLFSMQFFKSLPSPRAEMAIQSFTSN